MHQTRAWLFTDERPLPADIERFLDAGEPSVLMGFGSTPAPGGAVPAVATAARALGRRLIVAGGWAELTSCANVPTPTTASSRSPPRPRR
ncbi:hypothetical protein [Nocardia noduli]|uniref:hypothetical protein n=1 Tax=Nocardia noduli TaxID=2815722 RepID=UPI001C216D78|nr:hypothetical protein [Nocardia noduli]